MREATHSKPDNAKGFALVEAILAFLVLAIGLLTLGQLVTLAIRQNSEARYSSLEVAVAQGQVEILRAEYDKELRTAQPSDMLTAGSHTLDGGESAKFAVSWSVVIGTRKSKTVAVTVTPAEAGVAFNRSVTITCAFSP
jgi:Tfp pilus assembly protein PilV